MNHEKITHETFEPIQNSNNRLTAQTQVRHGLTLTLARIRCHNLNTSRPETCGTKLPYELDHVDHEPIYESSTKSLTQILNHKFSFLKNPTTLQSCSLF